MVLHMNNLLHGEEMKPKVNKRVHFLLVKALHAFFFPVYGDIQCHGTLHHLCSHS